MSSFKIRRHAGDRRRHPTDVLGLVLDPDWDDLPSFGRSILFRGSPMEAEVGPRSRKAIRGPGSRSQRGGGHRGPSSGPCGAGISVLAIRCLRDRGQLLGSDR